MNTPPPTLEDVAEQMCSHIREPYSEDEIAAFLISGEYNAELMVQNLLLLAATKQQTIRIICKNFSEMVSRERNQTP
jgi:hypothetical protein